ncbi:MAG: hypothetical protein ABIK43_03165, partial [candidate division WOR-3 bacterium]
MGVLKVYDGSEWLTVGAGLIGGPGGISVYEGTSFPDNPSVGQMCYRTDVGNGTLFVYAGTDFNDVFPWVVLFSNGAVTVNLSTAVIPQEYGYTQGDGFTSGTYKLVPSSRVSISPLAMAKSLALKLNGSFNLSDDMNAERFPKKLFITRMSGIQLSPHVALDAYSGVDILELSGVTISGYVSASQLFASEIEANYVKFSDISVTVISSSTLRGCSFINCHIDTIDLVDVLGDTNMRPYSISFTNCIIPGGSIVDVSINGNPLNRPTKADGIRFEHCSVDLGLSYMNIENCNVGIRPEHATVTGVVSGQLISFYSCNQNYINT